MDIPLGIDPSPENIRNIEGLIQQISLQKSCAFIGAGLSHDAGYPLFGEAVSRLKTSAEAIIGHDIDLPADENWDQIEFLRNLMGEENYRTELIRIFGPNGKLDYLPVHQLISSIPFLSWITTNFDYCLENAAMNISKQVTVQYFPELDITRLRDCHIFHIHGVIRPTNPEGLIGSIVFSNRDYELAYQMNTGLPRFLASLSEFCTLVFIGYSLGDSDLIKVIRATQLELERRGNNEVQVGLGKRIQPKHYIIMHQEAQVNADAIRELGLFPICYCGDKDRHSVLQKLLSYIRMRTTEIRYPEPVVYREMFEDGFHG